MYKQKKVISIYMIHMGIFNLETLIKYVNIRYDTEQYELRWNDINPEILIVSEHIYTRKKAWDIFVKMYDNAQIRIFFAGECVFPDLNIFDYAISFDSRPILENRVFRIPTSSFYANLILQDTNDIRDMKMAKKVLESKTKFCDFIFSNGEGHSKRKELFESVSTYKRVDSYGKYLNNTGYCSDLNPNVIGYRPLIEEGIQLKRKHKFSIACENATYLGYTSEKIFSAFAAHTVPIYWGNPDIGEVVNERAIINCHKFESIHDLIDFIKEVDNNDDLWCEMISQPWLTDEQVEKEKMDLENYWLFWDRIMSQDSFAHKIGEGTFPELYRKWFFEY